MRHQTSNLPVGDGFPLFLHTWQPDSSEIIGGIVIAHGFGDHAGRYHHVAEYLTGQGYAVYAPDHRGHGRTAKNPGQTIGYFDNFEALVEDLKAVLDFARREVGTKPLFLLGHSVGGLMSLYTVIKYQPSLNGLLVSASYILNRADLSGVQLAIGRALSRIAPRVPIVDKVPAAVLSHDPAIVSGYDADPDVFHGKVSARVASELVEAADYVRANLGKITLPTLVMHGSADPLAKPEFSEAVYTGLGSADKTIKRYDGFLHEILNETQKDQVLADIGAWLAAHRT
jgi:alpha-beta hydrolase superfamily lysophospholipase